eukprot:365023-Chlamydomonas_euryale.AAC.27
MSASEDPSLPGSSTHLCAAHQLDDADRKGERGVPQVAGRVHLLAGRAQGAPAADQRAARDAAAAGAAGTSRVREGLDEEEH